MLIFLVISLPLVVFSQVDNIELESLDDFSILEEFDNAQEPAETEAEEMVTEEGDEFDALDALDEALAENDEAIDETSDEMQASSPEADGLSDDILAEFDELEGEALVQREKERKIKELKDSELSTDKDYKIEAVDLSETELQNIQDSNPRINDKVIEEFTKIREENIEKILKANYPGSEQRFKVAEIESLRVQLKDISKSAIRVNHIPRGKRLIRLTDNKSFYAPKNLTVRAHVLLDYNRYKYIVNKQGNMLYKVHLDDSTYINKVTNLYRAPYKFTRLPKKIKKNYQDKQFDYSLKGNIHTGLSVPNFTRSYLKEPSGFAPLLRFEFTVMSHSQWLFDSGLTFMYENISGDIAGGGNYNYSSFSLGPTFKSRPFWKNYSLILSPRVAATSRLSYTDSFNSESLWMSETAMLAGLEKMSKYKKYGKFVWGFNYQRKWLRTNVFSVLESKSQANYDDSFAFYIGHQSDWVW